jgi:NDP-sugar pyrophosphorylase family protein
MEFLRKDAEISALYDLTYTLAAPYLARLTYPWEALPHVGEWILALGETLDEALYDHPEKDIWIARSAEISPLVTIHGPAIIGEHAELRPGAFLRGNVLVGAGATVGNSTELKNCILFDGVEVPHFNYVGDSILGYKAHLGAGAVTSNVKSDRTPPVLRFSDGDIPSGSKKCGAFLGDYVEVGCNSVLNPGTVVGRRSRIYPLSSVRGSVPADCIVKGERGTVRHTER